MFLFQQNIQSITISDQSRSVLEQIKSGLPSIKQTKLSDIAQNQDGYQFIIKSPSVERYYQQILFPLLNSDEAFINVQALLEFPDESAVVSRCPQELIVSVELRSDYALGDEAENELFVNIHHTIKEGFDGVPAAICYYIISEATVSICMSSSNLELLKDYIERRLTEYGAPRK